MVSTLVGKVAEITNLRSRFVGNAAASVAQDLGGLSRAARGAHRRRKLRWPAKVGHQHKTKASMQNQISEVCKTKTRKYLRSRRPEKARSHSMLLPAANSRDRRLSFMISYSRPAGTDVESARAWPADVSALFNLLPQLRLLRLLATCEYRLGQWTLRRVRRARRSSINLNPHFTHACAKHTRLYGSKPD